MSNAPSYSFSTYDQIAFANINGSFDMNTAFICFYRMYKETLALQGQPWGLFVDMRGWEMTASAFKSGASVELHLDRRNQACECWLVDHPSQGNHMVHYSRLAGIPLLRTMDADACMAWFEKHHLDTQHLRSCIDC